MGLMRCKQDSDCLAGSVCIGQHFMWQFCGAAGASGAEFGSGGQKQAEEAAAKAGGGSESGRRQRKREAAAKA
ncbi:hypothetical protein GUH15_24600, partial [Xanthomonas citri pv. citri]|nr:hypothetical protein [Xanthomonas citri pv. citri]